VEYLFHIKVVNQVVSVQDAKREWKS